MVLLELCIYTCVEYTMKFGWIICGILRWEWIFKYYISQTYSLCANDRQLWRIRSRTRDSNFCNDFLSPFNLAVIELLYQHFGIIFLYWNQWNSNRYFLSQAFSISLQCNNSILCSRRQKSDNKFNLFYLKYNSILTQKLLLVLSVSSNKHMYVHVIIRYTGRTFYFRYPEIFPRGLCAPIELPCFEHESYYLGLAGSGLLRISNEFPRGERTCQRKIK